MWHGIRCRAAADSTEAEARELMTNIIRKYGGQQNIAVRKILQDSRVKREHLDNLLNELADFGAIEFGEDSWCGKPKYIRVDVLDLVT